MTSDPRPLEDLVRAICEGAPVDWDALENVGSDSFRSRVAALRVVAGIAEVHRGSEGGEARIPPASAAPRRWAHLDVLEPVASGAFGDVYRAWDPQLDREVALKLLRRGPDTQAHADEAVEEGRLLARLRHPHIVSVYGAARIDGQVGLWMEYVPGRTLAQVVAEDGALPASTVAGIGAALCDALTAVHAAGLVHRDVKAQNVMLAGDGRVVLMDFGAGRDARHAGFDLAGTPLYLAPEVVRGAPASARSDIFSLGVLLRYAVTGSYRRGAATSDPEPQHHRLLQVIGTATAAEPEERFPSAEACGKALRAVLERPRMSRHFAFGLLALAGISGALILGLGVARTSDEAAIESVERAWLSAPLRLLRVPEQQREMLEFDQRSPLQGRGLILASTTQGDQVSIVALPPGGDVSSAVLTHQADTGRVEVMALAPDGERAAYSWFDYACSCSSLRVVGPRHANRTIIPGGKWKGLWLGEWRGSVIPALLVPDNGVAELVTVDADDGSVREVRSLDRTPLGFSLSPDRRYLAYDAPQHSEPGAPRGLHVVDVDTGREHRLSRAHESWVVPRWSPDGASLFFLERRPAGAALKGVSIADGRPVREPLTIRELPGDVATFGFVDSTTLGYWEVGQRHLFRVDASPDGRFNAIDASRVTEVPASMPAWSPDGRQLAFARFSDGRIEIQDSHGRQARLVPGILHGTVFPTWSPDATRLAFWTGEHLLRSLQVVDLKAGRTTEFVRQGSQFYNSEWGLSWNGDGTALLIKSAPQRLSVLDIESGSLRTFYERQGVVIEEYLFRSPNGQRLAFTEAVAQRRTLRVVALARPAPDVVLELDDSMVVGWHPDGKSVLAVRMSDVPGEKLNELWQLPLDGTPRRSLGLRAPGLIYVSLSPDGRQLAYASGSWAAQMWLMDLSAVPVRSGH